MPMWEQSTLQAIGKLAGDPLDFRRTQSQDVDPSHVLSTYKPTMPMHCYMVQYYDSKIYNKVVINTLWEAAMQEEYDSLLENKTWDIVPLPPGMKSFR